MTTKPLKNTVDARHEARKIVLQTLFESCFHTCELPATAANIKKEMLPAVCDDDLVARLLTGIQKNQNKIDKLIARCAPEWPLDQLPKLDLNILRIAIYELYIAESVPPKVAVDEAIELAKEFSGENSSSFVNGALGTVIKLQTKQGDVETALFIGAFQPLHKGHLKAIKQIASRFPKIVIGKINSSAFESTKNPETPMSFEEIKELLQDVLTSASFDSDASQTEAEATCPDLTIVDLPPIDKHDDWVKQVQALCPPFAVIYTNDKKVAAFFQDSNFPVFPTSLYKPDECNDAEIRRRISLGQDWKHLVPKKVERYLKSKYIINRIRNNAIART